MVKINIKLLLSSIVMLIFFISVAYADNLEFSDVDVKVGGKSSKDLEDGETIDEEAEPGDSVVFDVEVKSNFTDDDDLDIEDITITVTIEGIDDGDDLEEESNEFDLGPDDEDGEKLEFEVPLEVEEDTFDVLIEVEGEDENGTDHSIEMNLKLDVEKESHRLIITRSTLNPADVTCNRKNVQTGVTVINIGNEDEDDVTIEVSNSDLSVDLEELVDELTAEPNEDESTFSKTFTFNVPEDADAGSYPISISASYNDDREIEEEMPTLTVNDCPTAKVTTSGSEEEQDVEVISPTTGSVTGSVVQPTVPAGTTVTQESFLKSNAFVIGIIIAEVVAVIVGIVLVVSLFRRKS